MRKLSLLDRFLTEIDQSLRTVHTTPPTTNRTNPADSLNPNQTDAHLSESDKQLSSRLMRVNHAGEVAAQGLYRGQALTAKSETIRDQMAESAKEENDHLAWCKQRIGQLGSHTSYFGAFWYWGSFSVGAGAGLLGDQWSLGFVKETEAQVVRHLEQHIERLPSGDTASLAILQQMKIDEQHHGEKAAKAGAAPLPFVVRQVFMPLQSKVMTQTAYWL
ncbi:MAG: 2-polyprenyl-3-methyl-6-methoxy-1,4-benzoquinone monooxygenase [bacterium]